MVKYQTRWFFAQRDNSVAANLCDHPRQHNTQQVCLLLSKYHRKLKVGGEHLVKEENGGKQCTC